VALGLSLLVGVSCSSSSGSVTSSPGEARSLTVVGDSLSVLGRQPIRDSLGRAGWKVLIDAFPGRTTADQIPAMRYASSDPARVVIIELGTNDAIQISEGHLEPAHAFASIDQALDLFAGRCIVWVTPDRDPQRRGAMNGTRIAAELTAQAAKRPNLHIADFASVLADHPEYLLDDQVHLTDDGSQALADLMTDAIATCR